MESTLVFFFLIFIIVLVAILIRLSQIKSFLEDVAANIEKIANIKEREYFSDD